MPQLSICHYCELFEFNSSRNPVARMHLRIGSDFFPPGFEFIAGTKYGTYDIEKHINDLALIYFDGPSNIVLHMFVSEGTGVTTYINTSQEKRIYRYSKLKYLKDAREHGRFIVYPALEYLRQEYDEARKDNELIQTRKVRADSVRIVADENLPVKPLEDVHFSDILTCPDAYILCFSYSYDNGLFDEFRGSEACLVVHDVEAFSNRIYDAFSKVMPTHTGVNGRVAYGNQPSSLGVLFSKSRRFIYQREYRFAWLPTDSKCLLDPMVVINSNFDEIRRLLPRPVEIYAGSLADITDIVEINS